MKPESYQFNVGEFACYALRDGYFNYPPPLFFANVEQGLLAERLRQRGLPVDRVGTPYTLLLVDTGEQRILVDTGAGNLGDSASAAFPNINHVDTTTGLLVESLRRAGFQPADIDTVIITHAHPDHVAGTLDSIGRLVFANAHYYVAQDEWTFWWSDRAARTGPAMLGIARRNLEPLQKRLTLVSRGEAGRFEVAPGIHLLAAPGHTPGHAAVSVRSGDDALLHIADTALHPLHLEEPDWHPALDLDPEAAAATRQRLFDWAAERDVLLFGHHFGPFPALGRVTKMERGWRWEGV